MRPAPTRPPEIDRDKLARLIHGLTPDAHGRPYGGLPWAETVAEVLLRALERGDLAPGGVRVTGITQLDTLAAWGQRQPLVVETEERAVLVGLIWQLVRTAGEVEALRRQVGGLEAVVRLLHRREAIDWQAHDQEVRAAWERAMEPPWRP